MLNNAFCPLIEKSRMPLDKDGHAEPFLTYVSRAFDCLSDDLLIAKLNDYGADKESFGFLFSYLKNREQRIQLTHHIVNLVRLFLVFRKHSFRALFCFIKAL